MDEQLVDEIARGMFRRCGYRVPLADLIQAGRIGCWEAEQRYRPESGVPFRAYAARRVRGAMQDHMREYVLTGARRRHEQYTRIDLDWQYVAGDIRADSAAIDGDVLRVMREAMSHLTDRQARVLRARYMEGASPAEIAAADGTTVWNVGQILWRSKAKLRAILAGRGIRSLRDLR